MNEDKKTFLLELIATLDNEIVVMSMNLEENEDINDSDWEEYEQRIADLRRLLSSLKDNVYFT